MASDGATKTIELPGGKIVEFPASMTNGQVEAHLRASGLLPKLPGMTGYVAPPSAPGSSIIDGIWDGVKGIVSGGASLGLHTMKSLAGDDTDLKRDAENAVAGQKDQWAKAQAAVKRKEYLEAGGHVGAAFLPIVGPSAAHVGERIGGEVAYDDPQHPDRATGMVREPDVSGGIGEGAAMIATPFVMPSVRAGVRMARSPGVTGAAEGFGEGFREAPVSKTGAAVGHAAGTAAGYKVAGYPGAVAGGVAGSAVGAKITAIPAAIDRAVTISRLRRQQAANPAPTDVQFGASQAPPPAPFQPRALIGSGSIKAGPAEDTSFVRSVPAMPQPPNPRRALPSPPTVRKQPAAATRALPAGEDGSFVRAVPAEYPEVVNPVDVMVDLLKSKEAGEVKGLSRSHPFWKMVARDAGLEEVPSAESIAQVREKYGQHLREVAQSRGTIQTPPQATPASRQPFTGNAEVRETTARNISLAKAMHQGQMPVEMAQLMEDGHWEKLATDLGMKIPNAASRTQILAELKRLYDGAPAVAANPTPKPSPRGRIKPPK